MSRDWEIFNNSDINRIVKAFRSYGVDFAKTLAHEILEGYGEIGHTDLADNNPYFICTSVGLNCTNGDTHQALVFLRPIEEEEEECEHETSFMGCIEATGGWIKLDGRIRKSDFCPKCGKDLR